MTQDKAAIRREIEATRAHMGDTLQAIAHRLNPTARVTEALERSSDMVREAAQIACGFAQETTQHPRIQHSGAVVKGVAQMVREMAQERKRNRSAFAR
jgi:hypothetical protein